MAKLTKDAIKAAFIQLLEQKPYTKISVRDIVEVCGINRSSFYYHFQDIPSLLMEIIREQTDQIIQKYPTVDSAEEGLNVVLEFAIAHKRAVLHIYQSVSRDLLERHLWTLCEYAVRSYFDSAFPRIRQTLSETDRELVIRYHRAELFGVAAAWLESGMKTDVQADFHRLYELKRGQTEEMIRRCELSWRASR